MNNKLKRRGFFKPIALCSLAVLTMVSLTSCGEGADLYSGINKDAEYVRLGNNSVTNQEIYDNFRWNSSSVIQEKLNEAMIQKYLEEVKSTIEDKNSSNRDTYIKGVQDYLICDVFAVDNVDSADELNNPYLEQTKKLQYLDKLYQQYNIVLDADEATALKKLEALLARDAINHESALEYDKLDEIQKEVFSKYYDEYAEKLFARDYLAKEIKTHNEEKDEDEDEYYSDSEIKTFWNENYKYKYDLNAVLIRFTSQDEVNAVLKTFGLKTYRSRLYFIPQLNDQTAQEYSKYYDDFDFTDNSTTNVNARRDLTNMPSGFMLSLYIEMYNYVYPYRDQLGNIENIPVNNTSNRRDITAYLVEQFDRGGAHESASSQAIYEAYLKDNNAADLTYNGETLDEINSSLKSYLYTTLKTNSNQTDSYSSQAQSYGEYYYMAFKINDANMPENEKLHFTDESETTLDKDATPEFKDFLQKLESEMMEEEITQTYIDNALSATVEDCKIYIYDKNIEIAYIAENSTYTKTRKNAPEDGVVAEIVYKYTTTNSDGNDENHESKVKVTAKDIWETLEPSSGISTAVDILSKRVIKETDVYQDVLNDKETVDEFYDTLNVLLANFANGQLASYGYDSSIGKYNFMMLYFHTSDIDTIIKDYYCVNEASTKLLTDYSSIDLAKLLQKSANAYRDTFNVTGSNLLVYVDMDEDGSPDKNFDWTKSLPVPTDNANTYGDLAQELVRDIINIVNNSSDSNTDALTAIVTEYSSSGRFTNGYDNDIVDGDYDPTHAETYWAKYRVNGLYIKVDEIADVTNNSQYSSVYDVLKIAMYKTYMDNQYIFDKNGENPSVPTDYLETSYYLDSTKNGLLSVDGYNLYTLTSASINQTAEFTSEDDPNGNFENLVYIYNDEAYLIENLYSDGKDFSLNQVRAYLLEYANSQTSNSLPASISTAVTNYLQPMYTRFTSETSQFYLIVSYLEAEAGRQVGDHTAFEFNGENELRTASTERFIKLLSINEKTQEGYLVNGVYDSETCQLTFFTKEDNGEGDRLLAEIENLYRVDENTTWWDLLEEYAQNAFKKGE